ncbi:flavin reductase family protein [Halodesulfovibrio sp.]|jgi:flavin reductase (DIM6/NTAB) family NADH-FMN oxidoreductase RutF|uniref:flavin reductase family protein n=1 Tax=Halodesulfovibrio sp. TaxID=1912772 RepID=UPI0025E3494E|nr:flavin reductase family protein [Halodesulfovibrio sp.]MCT4627402.1 flavin reductase family protein [Halodesulfovibrio sp.]
MEKVNIGPQGFTLPMPQAILGTHIEGRPNYMALGWVTRVNYSPPLIGIGVHKGHATHQAITETGQFSINFPSTEMVNITDYVGLVSNKRVDKSELFDRFYGELKDAPLIKECPLSLECKLYETVSLPTNTLFIGEIVGTWCEERYMTDGVPDISKIKPFVLTMPDNRYWEVGRCVGHAWKAGKALKK